MAPADILPFSVSNTYRVGQKTGLLCFMAYNFRNTGTDYYYFYCTMLRIARLFCVC